MPSFKKIISALCAAAIVATTAVVPVMAADDDEVIFDADYTTYGVDDKASEWTLESSMTATFDAAGEEGIKIANSATSAEHTASMTLSDALIGEVTVSYETRLFCRGDYANHIYLGADSDTTILDWQLNKYVSTGTVNGNSYAAAMTGSGDANCVSPWVTVTHNISFGAKTVTTNIIDSDDGKVYYSSEDAFVNTTAASFGYIGLFVGRYNWVNFKNLKITVAQLGDDEAARLALNELDLTRYTEGETTYTNSTVAKIDSNTYTVGGDFKIDITSGGYNIDWSSSDESKVSINRKAVTVDTSEETTVTLTATAAGTSVQRVFTLNITDDNAYAEIVKDELDILEVNGEPNINVSYDAEAEEYIAIAGFTLPSTLNGASIKWTAAGTGVTVNGRNAVSFNMQSENTFTLTANISYRTGSATKVFTVHVPAERVFYNDSFDDWADEKFVSHIAASHTSKPGYSFSSATRSGGANDQYIQVADSSGVTAAAGDKALVSHENHNYSATALSITLTRSTAEAGFGKKGLYMNVDVKLTDASGSPTTLYIYDGTDYIALNSTVSSAMRSGQWRNVELVIIGGSYTITIRDKKGGSVLDTVKGETNVTKITGFDAGGVNHDFSLDNLYISAGNIPEITTDSEYSITAGHDPVTIASVTGAESIEIDAPELPENITITNNRGKIVVTAPEGASYTGTVTVTAKADIATSAAILVVVGTDENFADAASDNLEISGAVEKVDGKYNASGNITLPSDILGAAITWESSNPAVIGNDGKLKSLDDTEVTLKATVTYGASKVEKTFVIDLSAYKAVAEGALKAALADTYVPYTDSVTKNAVGVNISNDAIILNNMTFPTSTSVTVNRQKYTLTSKWEVSAVNEGENYLTSGGVIAVSDTDAHPVNLKRTVTFNGPSGALLKEEQNFTPSVQFNPEDVQAYIYKATFYDDDENALLNDYYKAMLYNYIVKFDAALDSNFSEVPSSVSSGTIQLKSKGLFGSDITWTSSNASVIRPSTSGSITVTQPSSSTKVTLTAAVSYETASPVTKTFSVSVSGTGKSSSSSGNSSSGGSTRTTSSGGISAPSTSVSSQTTQTTFNPNPSGFTDLDSVSWALTAINNLWANGIIQGKTSTLFCPNDNITRAEFAKILVGAFDIPTVGVDGGIFSDVPASHWAAAYVETAYQKGIITGYEDGSFDPSANVTRQDMAVMVMRAAEAMGYSLDAVNEAITFADADDIASYAQEAVATLQQAGIVNGVGNGAYEPLSTSTRAQACQMIYNVFN